jgi:hypothetical protein
MKTLIAAFALATLVAASASAKTESPVAARQGVANFLKTERTITRPQAQNYALMLGVAY